MRWKDRSIRGESRHGGQQSGEFPMDGEAAHEARVGMGASGLEARARSGRPGVGGNGSGAKGGAGGPNGSGSRGGAGAELKPEEVGAAGLGEEGLAGTEKGEEIAETAQPSNKNRVPEDMATLVLNNSVLGAGPTRSEAGYGFHAELDPASDAAVMLRVAAGDESSFNFLVQKHHRPMIHFLFRMTRNQAVAEELAQEVFLRVYRARDSYRAEARFTTWLYRIATNLAVNNARDTKHERAAQTIYLDAPDEETGTTPDVADDEPSVEQKLVTNERMAAIRSHVMALPERQRMAVLMHKYQGMDYKQIGDVLKLSESATKSLLFRSYQTLRYKLKEFV
jgi:RNA polymerase sigma-70 factor (ECF subfamily)